MIGFPGCGELGVSLSGVQDLDVPRAAMSYEATESTPRRRAPTSILRSEDDELTSSKRAALLSTTRDTRRNFAVAKWAIGKHLDYVSSFELQVRTEDEALNTRIEKLMQWWSRPATCDVAGRHSLRRMIRLVEAMATIDGDVFPVKLATGQLQVIEGDRIRTPREDLALPGGQKVVHGVVIDQFGAALGYCVHRRGGSLNSFQFERIVDAANAIPHAYFDRFDQVRGISPLSSGLNDFRDTAESKEYALAKAKICQLFGIKMKRSQSDALPKSAQDTDGTGTADETKLDFGRGNWFFDLDVDEDVGIVESAQPSTQFQDFMRFAIMMALKSLDIPYSFFSEDFSTYSGSRQAWIQYDQSAEQKRYNLRLVLDAITVWKLATWIAAGLLVLPSSMTLRDLEWEWVATGVPWIDPLREVQGSQIAVAEGFESTPGIVKRNGGDAYAIARDQARYLKYRADLGLPPLGQSEPVPIPPDDERSSRKPKESAR